MKELTKKIFKNNEVAIELFESNIYEVILLYSKVFNPENLAGQLIDKWVSTFDN